MPVVDRSGIARMMRHRLDPGTDQGRSSHAMEEVELVHSEVLRLLGTT